MTRRELIERLERASGPDRELDSRIEVASGLARYRDGKGRACYHDGKRDRVPHYTASLDAAVAFCERMLPGWQGIVSVNAVTAAWLWKPYSKTEFDDRFRVSSAATPAIALIIATLRALEAKEGT